MSATEAVTHLTPPKTPTRVPVSLNLANNVADDYLVSPNGTQPVEVPPVEPTNLPTTPPNTPTCPTEASVPTNPFLEAIDSPNTSPRSSTGENAYTQILRQNGLSLKKLQVTPKSPPMSPTPDTTTVESPTAVLNEANQHLGQENQQLRESVLSLAREIRTNHTQIIQLLETKTSLIQQLTQTKSQLEYHHHFTKVSMGLGVLLSLGVGVWFGRRNY